MPRSASSPCAAPRWSRGPRRRATRTRSSASTTRPRFSIVEVEWSFWQYRGEAECDQIPDPTDDDDTLGEFLDDTSPPAAYADPELADSYHAFTYQAMTELGYPIIDHAHIEDLTVYDYQDLGPFLPPGVDGTGIVFDPTFDQALLDWAATTADQVIIVDGEWDPWSGGAVTLAADKDARRYVVPHGTHGSSIDALPEAERADAWARLARWTGVSVPQPTPRTSPRPDYDDAPRMRRGLRDPSFDLR